jgi:hypothetical protein
VRYNSTCSQLVCGCQDGIIIIWDCTKLRNTPLHVLLPESPGPVYAVSFF